MSTISFAQEEEKTFSSNVMVTYEKELVKLADSLIQKALPIDKPALNILFVKTLREALQNKNSFDYPFNELKDKIHIIEPKDKAFKIFNWVVAISGFQRRYYGAIQMNSPELKLYPLFDRSERLEQEGRGLATVTAAEWYGQEYYNVLPLNTPKGKIYALFGMNNNSYQGKKKILDHLTFDEKGAPIFGLPVISTPSGMINRFILEYKKEAFVNLNFNLEQNKIIFDRLESEINDPSKRFTFVPSGRMDGFEWVRDFWNFVPNAIEVQRLGDGQAPIDGVIPNR